MCVFQKLRHAPKAVLRSTTGARARVGSRTAGNCREDFVHQDRQDQGDQNVRQCVTANQINRHQIAIQDEPNRPDRQIAPAESFVVAVFFQYEKVRNEDGNHRREY